MVEPGLVEQVGDRRALLVVAGAAPDRVAGLVEQPRAASASCSACHRGLARASDSAWKSTSCQRVRVPPQSKITASIGTADKVVAGKSAHPSDDLVRQPLGLVEGDEGAGIAELDERRVGEGRQQPLGELVLEERIAGCPRLIVLAGLVLGFVGLILLLAPWSSPFHAPGSWLGVFSVLVASIAWAAGSLYSRSSRLPDSARLSTGHANAGGGALLLIIGVAAGEWRSIHFPMGTWKSWIAFVYLLTFGSFIGFTAYVWLLRTTTAARVSTYAYRQSSDYHISRMVCRP